MSKKQTICREETILKKKSGEACVLVVLMKRPIRGKCKTRLAASGLGEERALAFANASIEDTLERFGKLNGVEKILYYAPVEARAYFQGICKKMFDDDRWTLVAMPKGDLAAAGLTGILGYGLERARDIAGKRAAVAFCGMDSPLLNCDAIVESFRTAHTKGEAFVCPANDGGYVLLTLPCDASPRVFSNVMWSSEKTCESQISQLKASGLSVQIGAVFIDVDEKGDLVAIRRKMVRGGAAVGALSPRVAKFAAGLEDEGSLS